MSLLSRRSFLGRALSVPLISALRGPARADSPSPGRMLDIHLHLLGIGDNRTGCWASPRLQSGIVFRFVARHLRVWRRASTFDEGYVQALASHVMSSCLDKCVIMAFDAVYDCRGIRDWSRTHLYVPNDYVFVVTARYPHRMVPCVSINPDRADNMDELEQCVARGARGVKILPPTQGVNLADKKHVPFFRRCAELDVPLIVHTGSEHAVPVLDKYLGHPRKLTLALECGCRVVACHCGTTYRWEHPDWFVDFLTMLEEYPNLSGDTAAMCSFWGRDETLLLTRHPQLVDRVVHGSDYPLPPMPIALRRSLGPPCLRQLRRIANPLSKDLASKQALGFGRASAERGYQLLFGAPAVLES